jgi:hypothetical protein
VIRARLRRQGRFPIRLMKGRRTLAKTFVRVVR